jgi:hypothetical protein
MVSTAATPASDLEQQVSRSTLFDALLQRRSRRFAKGLHLNGGPLAYASAEQPQPLTQEEEAALAFAACGVTGYALADLPYQSGEVPETGGGNIMTHFIGRTVPSADALHDVTMFVLNDGGTWMLKRPQDFPRGDIPGLVEAARAGRFLALYERSRVPIADSRLEVPRQPPFVPPFNRWSANQPGTTYFVPVAECTALYINVLLSAFDQEFAYFVVDDRNGYRPAGIGRFAKSKGGHLHDDPAAGRLGTVGVLETWVYEFAAIETGAMAQNLGLMAAALGIGGFPHFAAHPFAWCQALGFRMEQPLLSRTIAAGPVVRRVMKALKKDLPIPMAVGLEREGQVLIKPYAPPYYRSMEEAVLAFVNYKYAQGTGTFRDGGQVTGWRDGAAVQAGIPRYSDRAIAATIAYCEYVYRRYGRFPAAGGPFRVALAYQAHHVDETFYDRFYRPEALSPAGPAAAPGA